MSSCSPEVVSACSSRNCSLSERLAQHDSFACILPCANSRTSRVCAESRLRLTALTIFQICR
ncbi:unnamed protein product [Cylicostephanus goldi]|uniref:Uncharacterized protein n=1 Tax=Cylicostephanus goldi TaxID=71465 RepID=A0A3P7NXF5_CYLGO|nr:unnamed protein product [Cylicostephanus goldi]